MDDGNFYREMRNHLTSIPLCDIKAWEGNLFWYENEKTILPLATEVGNITIKRAIPAEMAICADNPNISLVLSLWSKSLKVFFWYSQCVTRILGTYGKFADCENGRPWCFAEFDLKPSLRTERFINFLKSGFHAIITDEASNYSMVLRYLPMKNKYVGYIPYQRGLIMSVIYIHYYTYFVVGFYQLHENPNSEETWKEVNKRARAIKNNNPDLSIYTALQNEATKKEDDNELDKLKRAMLFFSVYNTKKLVNAD